MTDHDRYINGEERENPRTFNSTLETVWNEFQIRDDFKAGQVLQEFMVESFELGEIVTGDSFVRQECIVGIRVEWLKARDKFCQQMVDDAVGGEESYSWILDLC